MPYEGLLTPHKPLITKAFVRDQKTLARQSLATKQRLRTTNFDILIVTVLQLSTTLQP